MPVLTPPDGALLDTIPAGRYAVQVLTGGKVGGTAGDEPVWTFVNGLTSFEPKPDIQTEDDTDITSDGWASEAAVGNKFTASFEALVKGDASGAAFVQDPGLSVLHEASFQTGTAAVQTFRYWRTDSVEEARLFKAVVKAAPSGGKPNELQKFSGELIGRGKPTDITKPETP